MIVLDQHAVVEPHPVVLGAAHPGRIFIERAQARKRLASVEQDCSGARDRLDIAARQGGNSRQMLQRVERRALRGEHRTGVAFEAHQFRVGGRLVAVAYRRLDANIGVERAKERSRNFQPRNNDCFTAINDRLELCI